MSDIFKSKLKIRTGLNICEYDSFMRQTLKSKGLLHKALKHAKVTSSQDLLINLYWRNRMPADKKFKFSSVKYRNKRTGTLMLLLIFTVNAIRKKFLVCKLYIYCDIKVLKSPNLSRGMSAASFKFMSYIEADAMKDTRKLCQVPQLHKNNF